MVNLKYKSLALPLIALQYHEVKINLEFREVGDLYFSATVDNSGVLTADQTAVVPGSLGTTSLFVDYIYLDTDERRRFAQVSHEYLIEQLQFTGDESTSSVSNKIKLNFNHPVKELVWVVQPDTHVDTSSTGSYQGKQWFNYTDNYDQSYTSSAAFNTSNADQLVNNPDTSAGSMPGVAAGGANNVYVPVSFENGTNPVAFAKLQLNGHDRFSERDGRYFNLVQPYQHHENVPSQGINVYSFGLKPEEHQPSGTCNFSRIDNATLQLTLTSRAVNSGSCKVKVFAVNYNVLRKKCEEKSINFLKSASIGYNSQCNIPCCGKSLKVLLPLFAFKQKGTRLITVPKGKNVEHWVIRRVLYNSQRLNGYGRGTNVAKLSNASHCVPLNPSLKKSWLGRVKENLSFLLKIQSASLQKQERLSDYVRFDSSWKKLHS